MDKPNKAKKVCCIGAGPAGLTAAYLLAKNGYEVTVLEKDSAYVGGISRTVVYKEYRFDIGGHRFFSKSKKVEDFWDEILPNKMLERERFSRIYYQEKFYSYPLKIFEALKNLGFMESMNCLLSYFYARIFFTRKKNNFEEWMIQFFGKRLYEIFFKTYTEKVWGMKCHEISSDWAAQRIKGLSLWQAVRSAIKFIPERSIVKSLIEKFKYPPFGPGMMWEHCANKITSLGGCLQLGFEMESIHFDSSNKRWIIEAFDKNRTKSISVTADYLVSSAAIPDLMKALNKQICPKIFELSQKLKFRDFIIVGLICKDIQEFKDQWIYIHDPQVKVARIQNYKNWSKEMSANQHTTCLGMEYFCFAGDNMWNATDEKLIKLAMTEIEQIGIAKACDILDACVIRQPKAYPVYDEDYKNILERIKSELHEKFSNLHLIGRNGLHRYNNQDHAIMTAMLTVENIIADKLLYDVWQVNQDAEYLETQKTSERLVPQTI